MRYLELIRQYAGAYVSMAVDFRVLASYLQRRLDTHAELGGQLSQRWSGGAARAAVARNEAMRLKVAEALAAAVRCDQLAAGLADTLSRAVRDEIAGVDQTTALDQTTAVDRATASRLGQLADVLRHNDTGAWTAADRYQPGPGSTPAEVVAWWRTLSALRQWEILTRAPATVADLDGVPIADRDVANRLLMTAERGELLARYDVESNALRPTETAHVQAQLDGLAAIEARLRDLAQPRAFLVELSTVGDGDAVVAVGDPDRASDVLTYIPGAGADLSDVDRMMERVDLLENAASEAAPDHRAAVVGWLGYDAPAGIEAVSAAAAHHAEPALDRFADGLRASHDDGARSHNTILGHSYGSLVAGVTARDRGLDADDLVFVGSPGVGVDRAKDLGLVPGHVWSATAGMDPIQQYAPGWGQFLRDLGQNQLHPFTAWYGDGEPDVFLWHGLNPSTSSFGARAFASDPLGGHNSYWAGPSLDAIAAIAVNQEPVTAGARLSAGPG